MQSAERFKTLLGFEVGKTAGMTSEKPETYRSLTLSERVAAYNGTYVRWPASHLRIVAEGSGEVAYGLWMLGNDYKARSALYGAYPPGFLPRVLALFPDVPKRDMLHAFSGSLPADDWIRLDVNPERMPEAVGNVYNAHDELKHFSVVRDRGGFKLVMADPPYSADDAKEYDTPGVDRRRATEALAKVTRPGGYMAWLDVCWPMFAKKFWRTVGRVCIVRSTNHRVRMLTLFERQ